MSRFHRWILKAARTLHLYTTLFGLALILFFALTGFMLNHIEWFVDENRPAKVEERPLPLDKLPSGKLPEADTSEVKAGIEYEYAIVESLRKEFGIVGEKTAYENRDDDLIRARFRRAGEETEVEIRRADAVAKVERKYQGWAAVATDLHRGNRGNVEKDPKFTGRVWSFVIDATCIILLIISATGLIMWWSLKTRGKWSALLILLGGVLTFAAYYWFVP